MSFGENIRSVYSTPKQVLIWENFNMKIRDVIKETVSGNLAIGMNGSGFVSGGIGTDPIRRNTKPKKKSKAKKNKA